MKSLTQVAANLNRNVVSQQPAQLNPEAAYNINDVFKALEATFPAFKHAFPTDEKLSFGKKVWTKSLIENGVTSIEQISTGMRRARASESDFVPSVGRFISWCKPQAEDFGLSLESVIDEVERYQNRFDDDFEFSHPVVAHIAFRQGFGFRRASVDTRKKLVATALDSWLQRLANGEQIPLPRLALESKQPVAPCHAEQIGFKPSSPEVNAEVNALLSRVLNNKTKGVVDA